MWLEVEGNVGVGYVAEINLMKHLIQITRFDGNSSGLAVCLSIFSHFSLLRRKRFLFGKSNILCSPQYVNYIKDSEYAFIFSLKPFEALLKRSQIYKYAMNLML